MSIPTRTSTASESVDPAGRRPEETVAALEQRAREELDPEVAAGLLLRAARLAREGDGKALAEPLLERALACRPGDLALLRELASLRESTGDLVGAAAALEQEAVGTARPTAAAERFLALGRLWEERIGRRDRAALFYSRASRLAPGLAEARRRAVACAEALGRFGHARVLLDAWRDAGGDRAELAVAYARLGSMLADEPHLHGAALDALVEALSLDRTVRGAAETRERLRATPRAWRTEAVALERRAATERDRGEAARCWIRLAALHLTYDPDGEESARVAFDRAWLASPGSAQALDLLERWYGDRGQWTVLREELRRLAGGSRNVAAAVETTLRLAHLQLVRFGNLAGAREALERAFEIDPANSESALHLFEIHVDAGRAIEAVTVLERHLAARPRQPSHAPLLVRAAELAGISGDPVRARRLLDAALRESPGYLPAARALLPLLETLGDGPALLENLHRVLRGERDHTVQADLLLRAGTVAAVSLGDDAEALRNLALALLADPARLETRRALEAVAARSGAHGALADAFRAAAVAAVGDRGTRKALLRRVAEIETHDLARPEESVRAWKALSELDPSDTGAAAGYDAALARAGQHAELLEGLRARLAGASGDERFPVGARIARLLLAAGDERGSADLWRELLALRPGDGEALWGLASALRATRGEAAAEELCPVLAELAGQDAIDRADLLAERATLLGDPLGRPLEAADAWLSVLGEEGLPAPLRARALAALEELVARGIDPLRIARALAPALGAAGEPARQVKMIAVVAGAEGTRSPERAALWLEVAAIRERQLDDPRGAFEAAASALREAPAHPEALRRTEELAARARAYRPLFDALHRAAGALSAQPTEERGLRLRAARVAEEELGSEELAMEELRRARAIDPGDPEVLAALTRLALTGERWVEACDLLAERERLAATASERATLATRLGDLLAERIGDRAGALGAWRRAVAEAPPEQAGRIRERLERGLVPLEGPAPEPLPGPAERLAMARAALLRDPDDAAAAAEVERLATELDSPGDLALALEQRLAAALFEPEVAFRLAEVRRTRLDSPAGALRLLAEVTASDPEHAGARQSLAALAREAGPAGREALGLLDALLGSHDPETRLTLREDRLAVEQDPAERARLQREIRGLLELDLRDPARALDAALGAFAARGPERDEAAADLPRLAVAAGRPEVLAGVYASAARDRAGSVAVDLLRLAARTLDGSGQPAQQVEAWRALLAAAPEDPEGVEALARLLPRPAGGEAPPEPPTVETPEGALDAFEALAMRYARVRGDPAAEPDVRDALCRAAEVAGREEALAGILAASVADGLPEDAAVEALGALAAIHRARRDAPALAAVLRRRAARDRDFRARRATWEEVAALCEGPLADPEGARAAWSEVVALLEHEADEAASDPVLAGGAAGLLVQVARIRAGRLHDPAGALEVLRDVLDASPGHPGALAAVVALSADPEVRAADAPLLARSLTAALAAAEQEGKGREAASLRSRLAAVLEEGLGDHPGVVRLLESSAADGERDPAERAADLARLGRAREHLGDRPGALAAYREARRLGDGSLPVLKGLAALLGPTGDDDETLDALLTLLDRHREGLSGRERAACCGWAARILEARGRGDEAVARCEEALQAVPDHAPSLRTLARLLVACGDFARAVGILERLLRAPEVQADHAGAARLHEELAGLLREQVGDDELALRHLEAALDADPLLASAFVALERIHAARQDWRGLAGAIERMAARLPDAPDTLPARAALWKELGVLQERSLGDPRAARAAYARAAEADPSDVEVLQALGDLAATAPGEDAAAVEAFRSLAVRLREPAPAVAKLAAIHLARGEPDRAFVAADVLAHLLRAAGPDELAILERLRRSAPEVATRPLDDVHWQRLLHERLRTGPVAGILTLLARDASPIFSQPPRELGLEPARDEIDLASSGLPLAAAVRHAARSLGVDGVRLFRARASHVPVGFAATDPPSLVAGGDAWGDRPRRELWFLAGRGVAFYRPELRLARLLPFDQLQAAFRAALAVGAPGFDAGAGVPTPPRLRGAVERVMRDRGRLPLLAELAREYAADPRPGDLRAHVDAVELTANRAGALLAGDLQVARSLVLEEKAQVSKLQDEVKVRDLVQLCLSEDWAALRGALGISVATR